jgi:hypothetical protein
MSLQVTDATDDTLTQQVKGSAGAAHMVGPSELPALLAPSLIRDLTTTIQTINLPSGALWVSMSYRLLPGATAVTNQFAKVVLNASSDADAAGKLATDGAFIAITQGDDIVLSAPANDAITRIDVVSAAAVGAEKTLFQTLAGVQA